jgi:hypothetical protein
MKRLFLTFFALVLSVGVGLSDAEAKRLGGGKSIGMQRSTPSQPATTTPLSRAAIPGSARSPAWLPAWAWRPWPPIWASARNSATSC